MPVRNAAPYLAASIGSILAQTYRDFELVILDDASTDESRGLLRGWQQQDRRIRLIESDTPLGLAASSDRIVREARAPICARMDADDVSRPRRLEAQMAVLAQHPEASLVGTLWEGIDARGRRVRPRDRWRLQRNSVFAPFPHGSVMFRRAAYDATGGYRTLCAYWEDFDLYGRMLEQGPILVIADALYQYRFHLTGATASPDPRHLAAVDLMHRCADRLAAGEDYASLLATHAPERLVVDPRTLQSIGSARLWAGHRTGLLGDLRQFGRSLSSPLKLRSLIWAIWGEASPRSLRLLLRAIVHMRDRSASRTISDGMVVSWSRPHAAAAR